MKKWIVLTAAVLNMGAFAHAASNQVSLTTEVKNDEQETLLADVYQRTLYVFDKDQGTNTSVCTAGCAEIWPAYIVSTAEAKSLKAPLGTITRAGGNLQLTYNGRPVYTYAFDRVIGDDQGDGIGGVWHYLELE